MLTYIDLASDGG